MSDLNSLNTNDTLPTVVILGRPNVGKSTLFNRLIHKRRAITNHTPGVTRDPLEEIFYLNERPVRLFDTGGIRLSHDEYDDLVSRKSYEVIKQADVVLLLLDIHEMTPEDETLIERLHPFKDKLLAAANKADNMKQEESVWNLYSYGFSKLIPISSTHGTGIEKLLNTMEKMIDFSRYSEAVPEAETSDIRLAVLGKPNTGKSTLMNCLLGQDVSLISDIPGTTRDVITGKFRYRNSVYQVLDTAGIRRKKKIDDDVEYYSVNRAIKSIDNADVVLLMVDSLEGVTDQDKKIAALMTRKGKGVVIVLNKWDLIGGDENQFEAMKDRVRFIFPILSFAPVVPLSAIDGVGIDRLLGTVWGVWRQLNKRVDTSKFNAELKEWIEKHEPPRDAKGRYKVFYGTQISTKPVSFLLFVNRKKGFPKEYLQYIINNIRKELGFTSIPISLEMRERQRRDFHEGQPEAGERSRHPKGKKDSRSKSGRGERTSKKESRADDAAEGSRRTNRRTDRNTASNTTSRTDRIDGGRITREKAGNAGRKGGSSSRKGGKAGSKTGSPVGKSRKAGRKGGGNSWKQKS